MVYRNPSPAPVSQIPAERHGAVVGRFCKSCYQSYPLHAARHSGKPLSGKDHVASPCPHEGDGFVPGEGWWEAAVEVLPEPEAPPAAEGEGA